jgi:hypothetical protein
MSSKLAGSGMESVDIDGNEHWVVHSLQTIRKLHSKLASNPSSKHIQFAGFRYGKRVRVPQVGVKPVLGVRGADLSNLLVQRLE